MEMGVKTRLDYEDYLETPDDGKTYELLDGRLYVTPAPSPFHQRASKRLQRQLEAYFEARGLGEVFDAPVDLILTPHDVVQPDLVVVTNPAQVSERAIEGVPALVVEVLSRHTSRRDRTLKAERYAALGIPHYWILDPKGRRLECYRLGPAGYLAGPRVERGESVSPPEWPGLTISLAEIFA
jgi:Uma2 family endonuclease